MIKKYKIPELISPAGDWPSLHSAIQAGADAVYFAVKEFNMRKGALNFDPQEIKKVISLLHKNNKKGYLALNTIIYDKEIGKVKKILQVGKDSGVDGIIAWDMAVAQLAGGFGIPLHLSTQACVSNFNSLKFFASIGAKRVVLARECMLADIKSIVRQINNEGLDCEIEVFIHGAMCVSLSGRCFLSQHSFAKSANRGECLQLCRREYLIKEIKDGREYILGENYLLSAKDLCAIDFIDRLIESGISAFKIEGRMRSPEYINIVTSVYREAIDAFFAGRLTGSLKKSLQSKLSLVFNRGFEKGFYLNSPGDTGSSNPESVYEKVFLGEVLNFYSRIGVAEVLIRKEGVKIGDEILIFGKSTPASFAIVDELQIEHQPVESVKKGGSVGIKLPFIARRKDKVFLWKKRSD